MKKLILGVLLMSAFGAQADCESGHYLQAVLDNGNILKTEDGHIWKVTPYDVYNTEVWVAGDSVLICSDGKMINTDESGAEDAEVTLMGR